MFVLDDIVFYIYIYIAKHSVIYSGLEPGISHMHTPFRSILFANHPFWWLVTSVKHEGGLVGKLCENNCLWLQHGVLFAENILQDCIFDFK